MAGYRNNSIFGPWESYRKFGLLFVALLITMLFVFLMVPLGICALILFIACAYIWRDITISDPTLGSYIPNTTPFKVALFFMALKNNMRNVLNPAVAVGLGPPGPDRDHMLEIGWTPPTRLAGYWAIIIGVCLAPLDYLMHWAHLPVWGDMKIPGLVMVALSAVGWFIAVQVFSAVRRLQGTSTQIAAPEPRPAVMLHRVRAHMDIKELLAKSFAYGAAPTILFILLWSIFKWSWIISLVVIPFLLLLGGMISASRIMKSVYVEGWEMRNERREFWQNAFIYMKDRNPILLDEVELPTIEEFMSTMDPANPEPYLPEIKVATFLYPPNCIFDDYVGQEDRIRGLLGVEKCAISPIGNYVGGNQEVVGSVGGQGFRVWWSEQELPNLLDPSIGNWMREFLVRSTIIPGLAQIRGIGNCIMQSCEIVTRPNSPITILDVRVIPPPGVDLENFLNRLEDIRIAFGVPWLRAGRVNVRGKTSVISLYLGHYPDITKAKFINPQSVVRRTIDQMDWAYYFNAQSLAGATGVPKLLERRPTTPMVDKLVFELPDGLSFEAISNRLSSLKTTSGNAFMEMSLGAEETRKMTEHERIRAEQKESSKFTIIASKEDPLKRVFDFADYKDKIFTGRVPGKEKIEWVPGIMADDSLAKYRFDDELPHLLLAGASGNGKSVVANSMILQLAFNNTPSELRFWMIEPKNEMQVYQHMDVVERFVDSWTPDKDFMRNSADLMEDAVEEMNNRYELMKNHPKQPKKLEKARDIARRESERDGTPLEDHPLYLPFIIIIVEECATLFADAASKDERAEQGRLLAATAEIARKARASGIYLVAITQYPTNASIPSVIRNQMRRVGLGVNNGIASQVVIGENGLEQIKTKGVGMVSQGGVYRHFRGLWVKDGDPDYNEPNDVLDTIDDIPSSQKKWEAGGTSHPTITIPVPSDTVYRVWDQSAIGRQVSKAVDEGIKTKDRLGT